MYFENNIIINWLDEHTVTDRTLAQDISRGIPIKQLYMAYFVLVAMFDSTINITKIRILKSRYIFDKTELFAELKEEFPSILYRKDNNDIQYLEIPDIADSIKFKLIYA